MKGKPKNNWRAKIKRTFCSFLPVKGKRKGRCMNCGECCKLPNKCPFLKYFPDGKSQCSIHSVRPLNCRKYPRAESEFVTMNVCGFKFEGEGKDI